MLLGLGLAQLGLWWDRTLTGLTIEPIVVPLGLVFLAVGLPRLLRARRLEWLERHGSVAPAEVLAVTPTREVIDGRIAVMRLTLPLEPPAGTPFTTDLRWPVGMQAMVVGRRVEVRHRPGWPRWVAPL